MSTEQPDAPRRHRILTRAVPLIAIAIAAFAGGMMLAAGAESDAGERFFEAWERGDYAAMHAELTPAAQEDYPLERFERSYADAAQIATISTLEAGEVETDGDAVVAPVAIETRVFGDFDGEMSLPVEDGQVAWSPHLVFPGLADNELLNRRTRAPERAAILAADRTPLAEGPAAARSIDAAASAVVGAVGAPTSAQAREVAARGFPPGTLAGTSGLELAWDERLAGRPGGQLLAVSAGEEAEVGGGRILATSEPVRGKPVRTTIDPALQQEAVVALGDLYGGAAVLDARDGSVLALSGSPTRPHSHPDRRSRSSRPRRTRRGNRHAQRRVPGRDLQQRHRPRDPQRPRRAVRRHLRGQFRALVQHRLCSAGRRARRREAGRDGREVRLQLGRRHSSTSRRRR